MKIQDIVILMKAGYTPGEIGSLERREETLELLRSGINKDDIEDCLSLVSDDADSPTQPSSPAEPAEEEDYKIKYEELQAKVQKMNNRQQQEEIQEKSADEILAEIVKDYM